MSTPLTAERRAEVDALHRAIEAKGNRIAIFMLGYWGALLFGANKAAELWPQYFAKAPFWAACLLLGVVPVVGDKPREGEFFI